MCLYFHVHICICYESCAMCMCYVLCAMCHVPCSMFHVSCARWCACLHVPCALFQCHQSRGGWNQSIASSKTTPPISTSSPPHYPSTFSTQRKPLTWWIVCHIISVTCSSFNLAEGILNHDIFLFVPNISTKALPVQKISRKLVWVQIDLIYLYNSLKSKVLNKMAQFFINRFSPKICHSFEVLLIGWEASL